MKNKKIIIFSIIICILLSFNITSFAGLQDYEAKEYVIKINNINEPINKIDLVHYEECDISELGDKFNTYTEQVSLYDEDEPVIIPEYDKEKYLVDYSISYNYLAGRAAETPENHIHGGFIITKDAADISTDQKFKKHNGTLEQYNLDFICVRTVTFTAYKLTKIKDIDLSQISNNTLTYKPDDLNNLAIGIRFLNNNNEYKTYLSMSPSLYMVRTMGTPVLETTKIIIYDYETREYKSNTEGNFFNIDTEQLILLTIIITILLTLIIFTLTFIIIKNKNKNNTSK